MNLDNDGTGYDPHLPRRRSNNSESFDLDAKFDKSGIEEIKTLDVAKPTIMDFKEFNYKNFSLIDCISLLQSVLKSPHAYSQNKAFTKHIVDALMQSYEEKLELEVSIPRKLYDEWEPTIKIKLKIMLFMLCVIWVLVSLLFPKLCVIY